MLHILQVSLVLSALQAGNKGTQACITAASAVSGIIADLDTTIMFASAGTLNPENEESFADHRCNVLATNKTHRGHGVKSKQLITKKEQHLIMLKINLKVSRTERQWNVKCTITKIHQLLGFYTATPVLLFLLMTHSGGVQFANKADY